MRFFFFQSAVFIAGATSTLLLTDIAPLSSGAVTPGCLNAYSAEIPQCPSAAELRADSTCTSECVSGLKTIAESIIISCRQVTPPADSLLESIMQGNIEQTLCGGGVDDPKPSTPAPTPTPTPTPGTAEPTPIFSGVSTIYKPSNSAPTPTSLILDSGPIPSYSVAGYDSSAAGYSWPSGPTRSPVPSRSASRSASPSSSGVASDAAHGSAVGGGMVWIGVVLAVMLA